MIALGTGGIKPCVSSLGADQFDDSDPTERVKQGSFFNWFYFSINIGSFISGTVIVWIQDNSGWGIGFAIPTVFMALAIASFFSASNMYRFRKPGGSPLTRVCQVVVAAFRKWHVEVPHDASLLYEVDGQNSAIVGSRKLEHTSELELLDKAAIISSVDAKSDLLTNPWRLCTVTQVEELKILVRMFPVWATTIIFNAVYAQNSSMFIEQGMVLDKRVGSFNVPPASLSTFDVISVMIWVPLYDRVVIPIARKFTGREKGFSELQRIGIGLVLSIIAMVSAALVEMKRLEIAMSEGLTHEKVAVPMSILWQIPQYFFVGAAEVFTNIGQLEFFYSQAPDAMRSLCAAFALITVSAGSYLSSIILTLVSYLTTQGGDPGWIPDNLNEGHLDRFFWLIAGISFVNLLVYIGCAMRYRHIMMPQIRSRRRRPSMDAAEERRSLVQDHQPLLLPSLDASLYTGDGSVDIKGRPATRRTTGNWRACFFILGNECCERLAYYGIATNLVTYLKIKLHQGNVETARNVTTWQGTCYLTHLIGAILADSYWGKYWTIAVFSSVYLIGLAILTLSASLPALQPPSCSRSGCPEESLLQNGAFFLGLYMVALGTGGIKPCVSSFGAEQFDDSDPIERVKQGSFFNWFYFSINIGSFIAGTVIVWIQDNSGWVIGFSIPTVFMALAIASFFSASNMYRFRKPGGSPLTRVCQVVVAAFRKWRVEVPHDASLLYEVHGQNSAIEGSRKLEHTRELQFLDKAAIILEDDAKRDLFAYPWRVCTVTQVEELKILVRMFPVWATTIIFSAVSAQTSVFIEQGMVLDKRIGSFNIPPASLPIFNGISVMICIPLYDRFLIPIARKFTGREKGFSDLQRIGIGLVLSIVAMTCAAFVELNRLEIARSEGLVHENVAVPMSILWQIPQYFFAAAAEVFTAIGQLEFFYDQALDAMRSLCAAFALITVSAGSYLSSILLTLVSYLTTQGGDTGWIPDNLNEGHLDRFFWLIAGIGFVNLLVYIGCAMRYKYKNV
ncbi:unnamed protein product [Alopecurus aequalis]